MNRKKPYTTAQIYRVALTHEQAILSVCTTPASSAMNGGGADCRPSNGCKRANSNGNNAARPS